MNKTFKNVARGLCVLSMIVASGCSDSKEKERKSLQNTWFDSTSHTLLRKENSNHYNGWGGHYSYLFFDSDGNPDTTEVVYVVESGNVADKAAVGDLKPGARMTGRQIREQFSSGIQELHVLNEIRVPFISERTR